MSMSAVILAVCAGSGGCARAGMLVCSCSGVREVDGRWRWGGRGLDRAGCVGQMDMVGCASVAAR